MDPTTGRVRVWDLPTRLFHWALMACVIGSVVSAKIGGNGVTPGGPGDAAGLKDGDVITQFDHTIIDSSETLIAEIWQHKPGDKVSITYTRNGSSHTTTVTLGKRVGDALQ